MNLKRISQTISSLREYSPEGVTKRLEKIGDTNERRALNAIISYCLFQKRPDYLEGHLVDDLRIQEGESEKDYIERGASFLVEAYFSPAYHGRIKHLLLQVLGQRAVSIVWSAKTNDSLTGELLPEGSTVMNLTSSLGKSMNFSPLSIGLLFRTDQVLRSWRKDPYNA